MTRGRCGSLGLHRTALSSAPPRRFILALLPLLHGHYPASSLLRSSAPLVGVSVFSASWVCHLCLFPLHHRPGSQVPYESPDKSHAACTPDPAWPVSRSLPCLSQDKGETLVSVSSKSFRRFLSGSFALISLIHT